MPFRPPLLAAPLAALLLCVIPALRAQQASPASPVPPAAGLDVAALAAEARSWLADLIRLDTTNPPGNELVAARYVAEVLQREGIPAEVLELAPGRGVAVARLQAGPLPDSSRALLLLAHLDVVGVERGRWSADPFGAEVKDGYLYGRGAVDDKGMVAANLAVMVGLKRAGVRLNRDVIFLAGADEEQFGDASIRVLIERHWDKIACAFAINEGGRVMLRGDRVRYVGVQASEKVPYDVAVIATGASGHGSVPRPDNAIVRLAAALQKIAAFETPFQPSVVTRRYFEQLSVVEEDDAARWMRALEMPERAGLAAMRLAAMSPVWNAMLRDTIAPTQLQSGFRPNVIPSEARATLNVRLLPGNSIHALLAKLQEVVADPQVRFEILPDAGVPAPSSSLQTELYETIQRVVPRQFPGAATVPLLSTGATDSSWLRLHQVEAYGLLPFPLTEEDALRVHGDDERIPLESFRAGVDFLYRVVHEFAAAR